MAIPWKSNRMTRSREGRRLGRIEAKLSASAHQFKSGQASRSAGILREQLMEHGLAGGEHAT
jgi:hypothetical protein